MFTLNPYLNFAGNTEEAFNFYRSVFGTEFQVLQRFKDIPDSGQIPEADREKIMHVALPIGKDNVLMGTDALESMGHKLNIGNNISLSLHTTSVEETDRLFYALSEGGDPNMPPEKMFWGAYYGMCTDKFGIQWMLNHDLGQNK